MFETQQKMMELEKANRVLEQNNEWYRHCIDIKSGLIEKLNEENGKLRRDIEGLEHREFCHKDSECAWDKVRQLEEKVKEITAYSQETNDENAELREENARFRDKFLDIFKSNTELIQENYRLHKNMEEMKKIVGPGDFEKEIERLKDMVERKDRYINSLEEANKELESENRKLWDKLDRIEDVVTEEE